MDVGLGRIAGILSLEVENEISQLDALQKVGSELAMHIVAAKPLYLTKELVTCDVLNNEREILKSQVPVIPFSVAYIVCKFELCQNFNFHLWEQPLTLARR